VLPAKDYFSSVAQAVRRRACRSLQGPVEALLRAPSLLSVRPQAHLSLLVTLRRLAVELGLVQTEDVIGHRSFVSGPAVALPLFPSV